MKVGGIAVRICRSVEHKPWGKGWESGLWDQDGEGSFSELPGKPGDFALLSHHHRGRFSEWLLYFQSRKCIAHFEDAHLCTFYLSVTHSLSSTNMIALQRFWKGRWVWLQGLLNYCRDSWVCMCVAVSVCISVCVYMRMLCIYTKSYIGRYYMVTSCLTYELFKLLYFYDTSLD